MSFEKLTKRELLRSANEDFAVDVTQDNTKKEIIDALEGHGVTFQMYAEQNPEEAAKLEPKDEGDNVIRKPEAQDEELYDRPRQKKSVAQPSVQEDGVLVRMVRKNPLYEVRGYRFTQQHPFQIVKPEDVDYLCLDLDGFRQATPTEVAEYYE